jgi:hypothetical protein
VPNLRAMVVIKNRNNLPEDAVVNTFHFSGTAGKEDDSIPQRLIAFYNTVAPSAVNSVGYYLSNMLSRQANSAEVRVYDMADEKPREPAVTKWALDDLGGTSHYPNEVAACLFLLRPAEHPPPPRPHLHRSSVNELLRGGPHGRGHAPGARLPEHPGPGGHGPSDADGRLELVHPQHGG